MKIDMGSRLVRLVEVWLDGHPLRDCVLADEENGRAVCFVRQGKRIQMDEYGEPMRVVLSGRVEIRERM